MKVAMEIIKWLLVVAIIVSLISAFATWAGLVDLPNRICAGLPTHPVKPLVLTMGM